MLPLRQRLPTHRPVSVFRFSEQCTRPPLSAICCSGRMKLDSIVSTALTVYLRRLAQRRHNTSARGGCATGDAAHIQVMQRVARVSARLSSPKVLKRGAVLWGVAWSNPSVCVHDG